MHSSAPTTRRNFLKAGAAATVLARPSRVFSEGRLSNLRLPNRLVRSATAEGACRDGEMTEAGLDIYRALARGGVGLIITGHMAVMPAGRAEPTQTCIYDDRFTPSIRRIVEVVHKTGKRCKVVAQIGCAASDFGPSTTTWPQRKTQPRALTTREVEEVVAHFAQAAQRAQQAGFDGVELHAAHSYLLSSFLSPYTNTRTDQYGGSMERRVTIIREIVAQARALAGRQFPILIKMNCDDGVQGGIDIDSFPALAREIEKAGVQAIEVSGNNAARQSSAPEGQSYFLKYVERLELKVPVILTGGNRSIERLEQVFKTGKPDFFGLARPLVREPDLPNRWLEGRGGPESTCTSCNRCLTTLGKGEATRCRAEDRGAG